MQKLLNNARPIFAAMQRKRIRKTIPLWTASMTFLAVCGADSTKFAEVDAMLHCNFCRFRNRRIRAHSRIFTKQSDAPCLGSGRPGRPTRLHPPPFARPASCHPSMPFSRRAIPPGPTAPAEPSRARPQYGAVARRIPGVFNADSGREPDIHLGGAPLAVAD